MSKNEALFYEAEEGYIKCQLCPHHCRLKPGQTGVCRVRKNCDGVLIAANYGQVSALAIDPIEKKPLFHFYPGKNILSVGTYGCNFSCLFCQNYAIAHHKPHLHYIEPDSLVDIAIKAQEENSIGLAFTYNEPSIWYEYILAVAPLLKEQGLKVVLVTNGYIEEKPLEVLLPFIDAVNIDVKAFSADFYRKICRGTLEPVLKTVEYLSAKVHIELTTLLIPGKNDQPEEIQALYQWLAGVDPKIPLHISRYFPSYKMQDIPPTPPEVINNARNIALDYLEYVYIGNLGEDNDTYCPECNNVLIKRKNYTIETNGISNGCCATCGTITDIIGK